MPPTPFMGLTLPTVGVTLGPLWATEVNSAFTTIDSHNHTTGQGVPVPTAGIAINADLPFNSFNLTTARSLIMNNNPSPLSLVTDITSLYASSGNLYYNNSSGQQVQITAGPGLNAASVGGFGGDYGTSTASAFYTSATSTFTFWQAPNMSAIMDVGPIVIHPLASIVNGITIVAPATLSSNYQLTLPLALPVSTKILTVDASGVINDAYDVDGTTIQVSSNTLQMGFPNAAIAASGSSSTSSTTYAGATNGTVSIQCTGQKIIAITLVDDGGGLSSWGGQGSVSSGTGGVSLQVVRDGSTTIGESRLLTGNITGSGGTPLIQAPPTSFLIYDTSPVAGVHSYTVNIKRIGSTGTGFIQNCRVFAYEI